jgi:hypothetical protein
MGQELAIALRERAVAALEISTTMLKVAQHLQKQGNQNEADRLRDEARYKRNESILLMDQARAVQQRKSNLLHFSPTKTEKEPVEKDQSLKRVGNRNLKTG